MEKNFKHRAEITVEKHEIQIIRIRGAANSAFCSQCRKQTAAFTPEQIALLFQISLAEVSREIETGNFHLNALERETTLICGEVLRR